MATSESTPAEHGPGRVGELVHRITDDLRTIAKDEIELAKGEVQASARIAAREGALVVLGGIVALIGLGMLCVAAVAALEPVIAPLWARLSIMAGVYIVAGGIVAVAFARRLGHHAKPDTTVPRYEAKRTLAGVKATLQEEGIHA